ncbi:MAG: four helix bundle protein [Candidatus Latescibacteria bacterium]|nr:four helix bundle protein [Candidatus Latescibacterota bacterium]
MEENVIREKSFQFAVRIVKLYEYLRHEKKEYVLSKQILRSGTSIGANVEEAQGGISKADFSSKISIAYKEARETHYWLRLLHATEYLDKQSYDSIMEDCGEICKLLFAIVKKTRIMPNEE